MPWCQSGYPLTSPFWLFLQHLVYLVRPQNYSYNVTWQVEEGFALLENVVLLESAATLYHQSVTAVSRLGATRPSSKISPTPKKRLSFKLSFTHPSVGA